MIKPWAENTSKKNVEIGQHYLDLNTVLIQIQDVCTEFVQPKYKDSFAEIHQFEFMDDDDESKEENITQEQADQIAEILLRCYRERMNIVVHCHAGVCRSGAVVEVAEMMGFADAGAYKIPNTLVKKRILANPAMKFFLEQLYAS